MRTPTYFKWKCSMLPSLNIVVALIIYSFSWFFVSRFFLALSQDANNLCNLMSSSLNGKSLNFPFIQHFFYCCCCVYCMLLIWSWMRSNHGKCMQFRLCVKNFYQNNMQSQCKYHLKTYILLINVSNWIG